MVERMVGGDSQQQVGKEDRVQRALMDGIALEYEESGRGEPVICVHGAFIADAFRPLLSQRALSDHYRLISFHRRGYVESSNVAKPMSLAEQASDCSRLLAHLSVKRAHVVGHSYGGIIALQLALAESNLVQTLALLEAGLLVGESAPLYRAALTQAAERYREVGAHVAVDEFLQLRWPSYRHELQRVLPGAFEQAVADAPTFFDAELPAGLSWRFGKDEAQRITQPVLVVLGEKSLALHPRFTETQQLLLSWLPNAEGFVLPDAAHFLQVQNPHTMAEALADFYRRHPIRESTT
jgi:pimeloyl-ACP methyl ester carboxylesterase